jgi:hypothetical protein
VAQAASSSALVTGLFSPPTGYSVTRIRGGAESDVEDIEVDYSQDNDTSCITAAVPEFVSSAAAPAESTSSPSKSVRCPYMLKTGQCPKIFASFDGIVPADLKDALSHIQGKKHTQAPPPAIDFVPRSYGISCPVPGCEKRMIPSSTRMMKKHAAKCWVQHKQKLAIASANAFAATLQLNQLNAGVVAPAAPAVPLPPTAESTFRAAQVESFWEKLRDAPNASQHGNPAEFCCTGGTSTLSLPHFRPTGILDFVPSSSYRGPSPGWEFARKPIGEDSRLFRLGYHPKPLHAPADSSPSPPVLGHQPSGLRNNPPSPMQDLVGTPNSKANSDISDTNSISSTPPFQLNDPNASTPIPVIDTLEGGNDSDASGNHTLPPAQQIVAPQDLSPAPSTPPSDPSQPDHVPAGQGNPPPPANQRPAGGGDGPPDIFNVFDDIMWDAVANWRGITYKHVPNRSRDLFRELGNIVFLEASTGQIGAVKASVMFARVILHVPLHGKARPDTVVKSRLQRWAAGEFQSLFDDLADYEVAFARRHQTFRVDDDETDKRVERKLADGEVSKALQAAMPSGPFDGPIDMLRALHPPPPPGITLLPLPENLPRPDVEPIDFYRTICETSRGTAQAATGWASDQMKDVNVSPSNEDEDPLHGFRAFTIAFATGTLPVSQEVFTHLVSSKLVVLKKPDSEKPRPVGVTGVFHRLGLSALLKARKEELAAYFGNQGECGAGIAGACQRFGFTRFFSPQLTTKTPCVSNWELRVRGSWWPLPLD